MPQINSDNLIAVISTDIEGATPDNSSTYTWSSTEFDPELLKEKCGVALERTAQYSFLYQANIETGKYISFLPEFGCCPCLVGQDSERVMLYEFIEAIDTLLDFDDIKVEFPSLSYAQINGAISFLRKLSLFNMQGVNIDELINQDIYSTDFLEMLRTSLKDKDNNRVLYSDQQDS